MFWSTNVVNNMHTEDILPVLLKFLLVLSAYGAVRFLQFVYRVRRMSATMAALS